MRIKCGDLVSLPASAFDGSSPGSFSDDHPEPCVGTVLAISKEGLVQVRWLEDEVITNVRLKDLTLVVRKATIANIIVLLVEGEKIAFESAKSQSCPRISLNYLSKVIGENGSLPLKRSWKGGTKTTL